METAIENPIPTNYQPGDHLVVDFGLYRHHGIACGEGTVIHFGRGIFDLENAVVEQVDLVTFCQGREIVVVETKSTFTPEEIVVRATQRIGARGYDLLDNNCEHFVNWCRSGESESHQANVSETVLRQTAAVCSKPLIRKIAAQAAKKAAASKVGFLTAGLARGPAVVAGVADAVQATVEIVAAKNGKNKQQTKNIGRSAGVVSSAALGLAVGGPVTAAAGLGFWMVGQVIAEGAVDKGMQVVTAAMTPKQESSVEESSFVDAQTAESAGDEKDQPEV
ncbi:MAG: lecithin retinol acyltransferase family protein [Mariniblastus sp.]